MTTSHLVRLNFFHLEPDLFVFLIARPIDFDGVSILLGCPQPLPWVGAVVDCAGRVAPSALARPRSKSCATLAQTTSQDPEKVQGYIRATSRSTMHEVKKLRSIAERWGSKSRVARLMPGSQGVLPPPPVEDRRSKQDQVKLVYQQRRGESTLH